MRSAAIALSICLTACSAIIGVNDIFLGSGSSAESDGGISDATVRDTSENDDGFPPPTCNADLKTDKANCGACGHDCSNGSCAEGLCTLASQQPGISHVVTSGDTVYLALQGGAGSASSCARNGCLASGPTELTKLDGGSFEPNRLAVSSNDLFVGDYYGGNKGGGFRIKLGDKTQTRFPTSGTFPRTYGVATDGASLVWTANDSVGVVYGCPIAACDTPLTIAAGQSDPELISISGAGLVVWADNSGSLLKTCPFQPACTPTPLVDFQGVVDDLTIDGDTVYWSTNLGQVLSCKLSGCTTPTVVWGNTTKQVAAIAVAAKDKSIFWATIPFIDPNNVDATKGEIHGCTLPGCKDDHVIAKDQNDPSTIAIDDKSVYWGNSGHRGYVDGKGDLVKAPR